MDGGAQWATIHGVAKSRTPLSDFIFTFQFHALEKEMATHSGILAWRILGMGAWKAAIYGVTQSWTRLTRLSSSSRDVGYDIIFCSVFIPDMKSKNKFFFFKSLNYNKWPKMLGRDNALWLC